MMMSTRLLSINVLCYGVIYFLCQVALYDCEVTLVTRNVTDSFRIGQDGCLKNASVCTTTASCQNDGSCLCNKNKPHFRNPMIIFSSSLRFGNSSGCVASKDVTFSNTLFGQYDCDFEPFQVLPNDHKQPATKFNFNEHVQFESCTFVKLEAKHPNNDTRIQINWLTETFMQLKMSGNTLSFQWRKSVPKLQGLIIKMNLRCFIKDAEYTTDQCLQAKVYGTWRSPVFGSFPTTQRLRSIPSKTEKYLLNTTLSSKLIGQRSESSSTVIIATFTSIVVFLVIIILLLGIYSFRLLRRLRMQQQRHNSKEMQTRNQLNVPANAIYEDTPQCYDTLDNDRRNNEVQHTYQGLIRNLERENDQSNENSEENVVVKRPTSSAYENPTAQDF